MNNSFSHLQNSVMPFRAVGQQENLVLLWCFVIVKANSIHLGPWESDQRSRAGRWVASVEKVAAVAKEMP